MHVCSLITWRRDILNHIYFDKKKLFLSVVLVGLRKAVDLVSGYEITLAHLKGDSRKPILHLHDRQRNHSIRILFDVS
jgi:hypothetical protein